MAQDAQPEVVAQLPRAAEDSDMILRNMLETGMSVAQVVRLTKVETERVQAIQGALRLRSGSEAQDARGDVEEEAATQHQSVQLYLTVPLNKPQELAAKELAVLQDAQRKIVQIILEEGRYSEVAARFVELGIAERDDELSLEQVRRLYSEFDGAVGESRLRAGALLVRKLKVAMNGSEASQNIELDSSADSPKARLASELTNLFGDLYQAEPTEVLRRELAEHAARRVALPQLREAMTRLPAEVLEHAAANVESFDLSEERAAEVLLAAAGRAKAPERRTLLRRVLAAAPDCGEARAALIELLLSDLQEEGPKCSAAAELAPLLVQHEDFDALALHYGALEPHVDLLAMESEKLRSLAGALQRRDGGVDDTLAAAKALEAAGAVSEAFNAFVKAFKSSGGHVDAQNGVLRLGVAANRQMEGASCLLGHLASRFPDLAPTVDAASQLTASLVGGLQEDVAGLEQRLSKEEQSRLGRQVSFSFSDAGRQLIDAGGPMKQDGTSALNSQVTPAEETSEDEDAFMVDLAYEQTLASLQKLKARDRKPLERKVTSALQRIEFTGFGLEERNGPYLRDPDVVANDFPTFWQENRQHVIYKMKDADYWMVAYAPDGNVQASLRGHGAWGVAASRCLVSGASKWDESVDGTFRPNPAIRTKLLFTSGASRPLAKAG